MVINVSRFSERSLMDVHERMRKNKIQEERIQKTNSLRTISQLEGANQQLAQENSNLVSENQRLREECAQAKRQLELERSKQPSIGQMKPGVGGSRPLSEVLVFLRLMLAGTPPAVYQMP